MITWDFDVMRHDVMFCVFRTKDAFKLDGKPPPTPTLNNIGSFNLGTSTAEPEHLSNIGRGWKEGEDYFRVEVPIVCHDGESIQGSHVTQHEATYILQWSHFDMVGGGQDMLDILTHPQHKAKVMYYCEVLNSLDYKGSMTSLQSTQSGFSCISKVSGHQSHHSTSGVSSGVSSSLSEAGRSQAAAPAPGEELQASAS